MKMRQPARYRNGYYRTLTRSRRRAWGLLALALVAGLVWWLGVV